MNGGNFVLKGDICHSRSQTEFETIEGGYLVCRDGVCEGAFASLPDEFASLPQADYGDCVIMPGLVDLHVHAPQFSFRGLGMDMELLEWLDTHTFPEEAKYSDAAYAGRAYSAFVDEMKRGPNTRAAIFATIHVPATVALMDMLEASGLVTMVGKVNMDRNSPPDLCEDSSDASARATEEWLARVEGRYANTYPIITPRFIPSCSDELMAALGAISKKHNLSVQSHLSENPGEVEWVRELCPWSESYADAYARFGMLGGGAKSIMAHCVYSADNEREMALLRDEGAFVAHCPQSNTNLSSGIAPVRKFLDAGIKVALGSDIAGGTDMSIFRAMAEAIRVSKLYWRLVDSASRPLSIEEAFYMGTVTGGSFFGRVGNFDRGSEFDALVIDDGSLRAPFALSILDRVARIVYCSDDRNIEAKYIRGVRV